MWYIHIDFRRAEISGKGKREADIEGCIILEGRGLKKKKELLYSEHVAAHC